MPDEDGFYCVIRRLEHHAKATLFIKKRDGEFANQPILKFVFAVITQHNAIIPDSAQNVN